MNFLNLRSIFCENFQKEIKKTRQITTHPFLKLTVVVINVNLDIKCFVNLQITLHFCLISKDWAGGRWFEKLDNPRK